MDFILVLLIISSIYFLVKLPNIKGRIGEVKVYLRLKTLGSDYVILNDILINQEGNSSQIDHIVVSIYGIFVIETKNYNGWIFGTEKSEQWTQVIFNHKYTFRNPIKQNWGHIYALKNLLSNYNNIVYIPIIVFSGNGVLKNITSSVPVINASSLCKIIKRKSISVCLSKIEKEKIVEILKSNSAKKKETKKEHIKTVKKVVFERRLKEENLICPYCNTKLVLRNGKYGEFYGCKNYPDCKYTLKP
jgi:hypothetical protein